jgi:acetylornithine/succinyldiaminopimelate/putrescine aminotransferase
VGNLSRLSLQGPAQINSPLIISVRGMGLLTCLEIDTTHETVIRFAPPLIITRPEIDQAISRITDTFREFEHLPLKNAVGNSL